MDLKLAGKTAFISGSTQGIGRAIAAELLAEGASVIINGRDQQRVEDAVARLRTQFPSSSVSGIAADFADIGEVDGLVAALPDLDILVNNVGVFELAAFETIGDPEWQRCLDVNLLSAVRLSRHVLPGMLARNAGRIISIASESGVNVPADMIHYGVTKAGLIALTNGVAKLTRGTAVTVNTVLGGPTMSDGVSETVAQIANAQGIRAEALATAIIAENHTSLLERFIEPAEIAHLVTYLASPLASATNGAALRADGGVLTAML